MDDKNLSIIAEVMDKLQGLMDHSPEELDERLGRPKVEVEMEPSEPMEGDEMAMDGDEMDMEAPEDKLKQRIMRLRG